MPITAALIQALGVLAAALASIYLWRTRARAEAELEREENARRRRERVRDVLVAIRAEIAIEAEPLALQFDPARVHRTRAKFVERLSDDRPIKDKKDMPQGTVSSSLFVFNDLKSALELLPPDVIDDVVRFYKYDQGLSSLIQAFSAGVYQDISDERQTEAVDALIALGIKTLRAAFAARRTINQYFAGDPDVVGRWTARDEELWVRLNEDDDGAAHG